MGLEGDLGRDRLQMTQREEKNLIEKVKENSKAHFRMSDLLCLLFRSQ